MKNIEKDRFMPRKIVTVPDVYADATVKSKLKKSKKISTSLWYPHEMKGMK